MKKITLLYLLLISGVGFAQQYTYIDFGFDNAAATTPGNWNNVASNVDQQSGISIADMIDYTGASTGASLVLDDVFHGYNLSGDTNPTTTPITAFNAAPTATADNLYGEDVASAGITEPTGGFTLSGLDPTKYYSFSIFAARAGVSDNREAEYIISGFNSGSGLLNATNNTSNVVEILNIQPTVGGQITFTAQPGPNNTNANGFYYLGVIEMVKSDSTLSSESMDLSQVLNLHPNPVSDHFEVSLNLQGTSKVQIDLYDINGRVVSQLFNGEASGNFNQSWNRSSVSNLSSGIYFLQVNVDDQLQTKKVILK